MKKLKDFEKEINKCSKCGLCQGVCPVFQATGNECAVSKGKFIMLQGVLKGDLKLSSKINSYLDLCLKCDKCSKFCPAGIDVCEILQTAKYEYISTRPSFKILQCFHNIFDRIVRLVKPLRRKSSGAREILYFKGCVNEVYPSTENALKKLLNKVGIRLVNVGFSCCGLPFFSAGNLEKFEEVKARNTELINSSPSEIVLGLNFEFNKVQKVTFHQPCHLENADFLPKLLEKCKNVEFTPIPEGCCGLAGEFVFKKPQISNELARKKAHEIKKSGAKIVLTSCPACVIGLKKALWGTNIKVLNIIDFLSRADKIKTTHS